VLNVGPKPDGTIPQESVERLAEIGRWMRTHGKAIYGTRRWEITREGPTTVSMEGTRDREARGFTTKFTPEDIWFTTGGDNIYAMALEVADDREVLITSFAGIKEVKRVRLLGMEKSVKWELRPEGLWIKLPKGTGAGIGYALEIAL